MAEDTKSKAESGSKRLIASSAVMWIGVGFLYAPVFYRLTTVYGVGLPHAWTLIAAVVCIIGGCCIGLPKGFWRSK